jgi:hypothetical protein
MCRKRMWKKKRRERRRMNRNRMQTKGQIKKMKERKLE